MLVDQLDPSSVSAESSSVFASLSAEPPSISIDYAGPLQLKEFNFSYLFLRQ